MRPELRNLKSKKMAEQSPEIMPIHYLKVNDFRTVIATEVVGGPTVNGAINMNFFIDRQPIPRTVVHRINNNALGEEIERDAKEGVVREVPFGVILDLETARTVRNWLDSMIQMVEQIKKAEQIKK